MTEIDTTFFCLSEWWEIAMADILRHIISKETSGNIKKLYNLIFVNLHIFLLLFKQPWPKIDFSLPICFVIAIW